MPVNNFNEAHALMADPFEGDFGEIGDRTLTDKIVTARKVYECHDCCGTISTGEKCRARTDIIDGEIHRYRWCHLCCAAMAVHGDNDGDEPDEWGRRIGIGQAIRAQRYAEQAQGVEGG